MLTNWANEKLRPPGSDLPTFRSNFYINMFEVILRLKANYLWPGGSSIRTAAPGWTDAHQRCGARCSLWTIR